LSKCFFEAWAVRPFEIANGRACCQQLLELVERLGSMEVPAPSFTSATSLGGNEPEKMTHGRVKVRQRVRIRQVNSSAAAADDSVARLDALERQLKTVVRQQEGMLRRLDTVESDGRSEQAAERRDQIHGAEPIQTAEDAVKGDHQPTSTTAQSSSDSESEEVKLEASL
jgi:TolA-binding protein